MSVINANYFFNLVRGWESFVGNYHGRARGNWN